MDYPELEELERAMVVLAPQELQMETRLLLSFGLHEEGAHMLELPQMHPVSVSHHCHERTSTHWMVHQRDLESLSLAVAISRAFFWVRQGAAFACAASLPEAHRKANQQGLWLVDVVAQARAALQYQLPQVPPQSP
jgi:hypothetical protein